MFSTIEPSVATLAYLGVVVALAYFVRGVAGFGSGLLAVPLMALALPLSTAVPVVAVLDFLASATHAARGRHRLEAGDLLALLPFALIGVLVGLYVFSAVDPVILSRFLGAFVIGYGLYALLTLPVPHGSRVWAVPLGAAGGLVDTLFGTGGPFVVIYLALRGLDKRVFRATVALALLSIGAMRLAGYSAAGLLGWHLWPLLALGLPLMAAGLYIGGHVHLAVRPETFRRVVHGLVLASGVALLLKTGTGLG